MTSIVADVSRAELYRDGRIRRLLALILTRNEEVPPKRGPTGEYYYPQADEILGISSTETIDILNQLATARILEKEVVRTQTICPACKSAQLLTRLECPFCMTNNLRKVLMIVHSCGHSGPEEAFRSGKQILCPQCGLALTGEEFRKRESVFQCVSCFKALPKPVLLQECDSCGNVISYESSDLRPVYAFKVNPAVREEILETCTIDVPVSKRLRAAEFVVTSPAIIQGKLASHSVDIQAIGNGKTWVVNILNLGREGNVDDITEIMASSKDIRADKSILVVIPKLSNEAKRLTGLFQITIIEGSDVGEVVGEIDKLIQTEVGK